MDKNITFYVPIHSNFSQTEHTAAFLQYPQVKGKMFFYLWNPASKKMMNYYSQFSNLQLFSFSIQTIIENLQQESNKVIVLLTASTNYSFGEAQKRFFELLQKYFPDKIRDVFFVGHCLFGCQSCGIREHQIPVYFSRYFNHQLPYSRADIEKQLNKLRKKPKRDNLPNSVLICPSVGVLSYLSNPTIIDTLVEIQNRHPNFVFMVKLHGFCFLENHPLSGLSDLEKECVNILRKNFVIVDESQFTILPLLETFDIIITDLDSSVAFESLYFPNKIVLAYKFPSQNILDSEYLQCLKTFSYEDELIQIMNDLDQGKTFSFKNGIEFFKSKYGIVDGKEVERISTLRKWNDNTPQNVKSSMISVEDFQNLVEKQLQEQPNVTAADYLACGLTIPASIIAFDRFILTHKIQLESIAFPKHLWSELYSKLSNEIFDAGNYFQLQYNEGYQLVLLKDIKKEEKVFLIDHAWTTDFVHLRETLMSNPALVDRLFNMMDLEAEEEQEEENEEEEEENKEEKLNQEEGEEINEGKQEENESKENFSIKVNKVWSKMWKYNQTYKILTGTGVEQPVWYIMDEVGSAIQHSDTPSFVCVPFLFGPSKTAFNLLWPSQDIFSGSIVTRNFYPTECASELERNAHLYVWTEKEEVLKSFQNSLEIYTQQLSNPPYPPRNWNNANFTDPPVSKFKVYSDIPQVRENLKLSNFQLVDNIEVADILFLTSEFKKFGHLKTNQYVNQFPNEMILIFKNLLPVTITNCYGPVSWLPTSFNLQTQLPEFIAYYKQLEKEKHGENYWIVKPWNAGRSIDISITNNLPALIRLSETGPKVASKYIEKPILYEKRKFDLRYIVLLKSIAPLQVYVYNLFWIRLANIEYSLEDFENYQKHFTVMNYTHGANLTQLHANVFKVEFEKQHRVKWVDIQKKINEVFKKIFIAASSADPPNGLANNIQCRAMYGIDLMINEKFEPEILEVNFNPDCTRACNYDPQFFDNVFSVLFLKEEEKSPWLDAVTKL